MRNTVHNVGRSGLVRDIKPQLLPSEFWTDGRNVRFEPNKVYAMGGVVEAQAKAGVINAGLIASPTQKFIVYSANGKVYSFDGDTESDITRVFGGDYSDDLDNQFTIQSFNGVGLLNNGIDVPQQWDTTLGTNKLEALDNWDPLWTAKKIRQYKAFLIALNMTEGVNLYPHKMRWSAPAEPGAVPVSWDESDPTNEAGEFSFADTDKGVLVDGLEMGGKFYAYKEGSIWVFSYVGGTLILSRDQIVDNVGLRVPRSLINIPYMKSGQKGQFFVGDRNFYVMNGLTAAPVFENVFKNDILKRANMEFFESRSFSVINYREQELWFCFPQGSEELPSLAVCLDFVDGTSSLRDLDGTSQIVAGIGFKSDAVSGQVDLRYSDDTFYSDDTGFYNVELRPGESVVLETSVTREKIYYADVGVLDYDQVNEMPAYVLRESLPTIKNDSRNEQADIVDYRRRKLITSVTGKFYSGTAALTLGVQETENDPIVWLTEAVLPTEDWKYDMPEPVSGRFHSFRFAKIPGSAFEMGGFDYDVAVLGIN